MFDKANLSFLPGFIITPFHRHCIFANHIQHASLIFFFRDAIIYTYEINIECLYCYV